MESKDELKEFKIKSYACYYFNDVMRVIDIGFSDILLTEKSYENILIYNISYKIFMGAKPLCIWFKKIDGFIKIYDGIRYLILFASERYNAIYDKINYLISQKIGITYSVKNSFAGTRIDSYSSLTVEKTLTFHVIILINSVVNKNENNYYYNIFIEKSSYEDKSNTYFSEWTFLYYK